MKLARIGLLILASALVAACGDKPAEPATPPASDDAAQPAVQEPAAPAGAQSLVVIDVNLPFQGAVLTDETLTGSSGKVRRQVAIVIFSASREQVLEALKVALEPRGYKAGSVKDDEGSSVVNFKFGEDVIGVSLQEPKKKDREAHPDATVKLLVTKRV